MAKFDMQEWHLAHNVLFHVEFHFYQLVHAFIPAEQKLKIENTAIIEKFWSLQLPMSPFP